MIAILLDALAAYLLRKYFSTKVQFLIFGVLAGIINSITGTALSQLWLDDPPGAVILSALTGAIIHPFIIFLFLFLSLRSAKKKAQQNSAEVRAKLQEKQWDERATRIAAQLLKTYAHMDLDSAPGDSILEDNLSRLPTEEIAEKLRKNYFSDDAIPSVYRVLMARGTAHHLGPD